MAKRRARSTMAIQSTVTDRTVPPYRAGRSTNTGMSPEIDYDSSNSDTDLDPLWDTDTEPAVDEDSDISSCEEPDAEPDAEAGEIMGNIARFREEGPAKPNHTAQTIRLWETESGFWKTYCAKIQRWTGLSPKDQLQACDPSVFKSYLFWRKKSSRIKKESAIGAYWKRISMYYHDEVGHAIANDVLKDISNWIPSLGLDRSKKEKLAMFVQDLYAIHHALWVDDIQPLHGFIRTQISLLLLLSAATATRPGALVESLSNKGSNKALRFKDVQLMKVRTLEDPNMSTIVANVNLEHVKNKERDGTPKKFSFRLEGLPALCIVLYVLGIGKARSAFLYNYTSVQQLFDLVIPAARDVLRIKWKKEVLDQPFFCDVTNTSEGGCVVENKAFPYAKYRDIFVRLGRVVGFEAPLELYQLRRASGSNINSAVSSVERNQTMGHRGDTYERYYTPTHIPRDFQAIYFGTPSEEALIRSVASMGLSRDRRAPVELSGDQRMDVRSDPILVALRDERDDYKQRLKDQGFFPLHTAKGFALHNRYEETKKKIASTYQQLHRIRLNEAIREFHDSVDTIEIARQLSGKPATEILTLPAIDFELGERAAVAAMLFEPIENDKTRVRFVRALAQLCHRQETRRPKTSKRGATDFVVTTSHEASSSRKRKKGFDGDGNRPRRPDSESVKEEPDAPEGRDIVEIRSRHLFPTVVPYPICFFCASNEKFSYERRMKRWERKDVLTKHEDTHFRDPKYQGDFECPYPNCSQKLDNKMHFQRHSFDVHKLVH